MDQYQSILYTVFSASDADKEHGEPLPTAYSDNFARIAAKEAAKAKGWGEYTIEFSRSNGVRGTLSKE